uniref:BHLH domain-containing protein n=1 Tax=Felis catus TaxID=9685 RepID=A0ABI7XZ71_FELCA
MKVATGSAAAAAGPSCALKAGKTAGGAGEVVRCLSEQSVAISRCAGGAGARLPALLDEQQVNVLLYDMNGCYSRLKELVPTLPQNRKVSRVEILQHVIDYIWDLELELNSESQVGTPGGRGLPARAPLSTLNGEISALAAEVRRLVFQRTIAFCVAEAPPSRTGRPQPSREREEFVLSDPTERLAGGGEEQD